MAFCSNCGNQISDLATACPQCGTPTQAVAPPDSTYPYPLAGFWIRFVASLLDGLILLVAGFILGDAQGGVAGTLIGFLYNWLMLAYNDGRTLGKMALGIRIARPDGSAIDLGTAAARSGMAIVSGIPFALGYIWAAFDSENRTWHDMVANTRSFSVR